MKKVVDIAARVGRFDETALFRGENANVSGLCPRKVIDGAGALI